MRVMIVAKTHMRGHSCVGGFELESKRNLRLLTEHGENQSETTDFEVGQIWDISYELRQTITHPHVEDILIRSRSYIGDENHVGRYLLDNALVWRGGPNSIFQNLVQFNNIGKSGYVTKARGIPSQSVGFWLPDESLEFTILEDAKHYLYFGEHGSVYAFPYVGFAPIIDKIKKGTLVRVSLARWWRPGDHGDFRCYCQLSGWYNDFSLENSRQPKVTVEDDLPF